MQGYNASAGKNWRLCFQWNSTPPLKPFEQHGHLRRRQHDRAILHRRPGEASALQALLQQPKPRAVPCHDADPIGPAGPENEDVAGEGIVTERLLNKGGKAIHPFTAIHRNGRHHDALAGRHGDHHRLRNAASTRRSVASSTKLGTRTVAMVMTISIWPLDRELGRAAGGAASDAVAATDIGTKSVTRSAAKRRR